MKFGLYIARPKGCSSVNIGDYVQSVAARQYLPQVDELYNREAVDPGGGNIRMIMNAWHMHDTKCFPPSSRVTPLPISMHLDPHAREAMLSSAEGLRWFKENEPIGCRDTETRRFLESNGVRAYFSGCLTLTLGKKYRNAGERRGLVFVDPYLARRRELRPLELLAALLFAALHFRTWLCARKKLLAARFQKEKSPLLAGLRGSAVFVRTYSRLFSLSSLRKAEFVTHIVKIGDAAKGGGNVDEALLLHAEALVKKYAAAGIVVTSRLHCALPCLAVGTPVLFADGERLDASNTDARFGGLIGLLNVARVKGTRFAECPDFPIKNKEDYKPLAQKLEEACEAFAAGSWLSFSPKH